MAVRSITVGLDRWRRIPVRTVEDERGSLGIFEDDDLPFALRRAYVMHGVPAGARRAGHAHRSLAQVLVALSGAVDVVVDDGCRRETVTLDEPTCGLLIGPNVWRELGPFRPGTVCLVLASAPYDPADYIHGYDEFLAHVHP